MRPCKPFNKFVWGLSFKPNYSDVDNKGKWALYCYISENHDIFSLPPMPVLGHTYGVKLYSKLVNAAYKTSKTQLFKIQEGKELFHYDINQNYLGIPAWSQRADWDWNALMSSELKKFI
jgi:hypothetical protein